MVRDIRSKWPFPPLMCPTGVILADHVKSVDWKGRRAERARRCSTEAIDEVRSDWRPCSDIEAASKIGGTGLGLPVDVKGSSQDVKVSWASLRKANIVH